jgi:hypothetical protein
MAEPSARSGVRGLSSSQVRSRALKNTWGPLPVVRHDAREMNAGKKPAVENWQLFAQYGAALPTADDLARWERGNFRAPGTGFAMGNQAAFDLDFLCDPAMAVRAYDIAVAVCGETPFVREGQAPKRALVYRAAEPIASLRLKNADGYGDGIDILGQGSQLVGFGIHPGTRELYRWLAESPLTATPDAAPAITNAQIEEVLARIGRWVTLVSAKEANGGRKGGGGGGGCGTIVPNAEGLIEDGRETWLFQTVFRTAKAMHAEGVAVEVVPLASRSWDAFEATTVLTDGKWTRREARQKAEALVRKVKAGKVDLGRDKPEDAEKPVEPTYPARALPVEEARPAVEEAIRRFLDEVRS